MLDSMIEPQTDVCEGVVTSGRNVLLTRIEDPTKILGPTFLAQTCLLKIKSVPFSRVPTSYLVARRPQRGGVFNVATKREVEGLTTVWKV